jgi:predicted PurR-regulated permease PerM
MQRTGRARFAGAAKSMMITGRQRTRWAGAFFALGTLALTVTILHWAAPVLIPIGIAVLLAFLLTPAVRWLEGRHIPRVIAVTAAVLSVIVLLGGLTWVVVRQSNDLLDTFPQYEDNLRAKIAMLRGGEGTIFSKLRDVARKVDKEISGPPSAAQSNEGSDAVRVTVVKPDNPLALDHLPEYARSAAPAAGGTVLAFALLAFMLMRREDLRERIFGIAGRSRLPITTRAIDEATERITRMLLTQFTVNSTFGVAYGLGLYAIGIPFAPLWGLLAIAFRYVPFIGAVVILALPFMVSVLTMQGWTGPLLVIGWFMVLEIAVMGLEAWLIGPGIGVSPTATLVMLAFWTWLWGPIALLIATPLTACLMVIARFLPSFRFLELLLGNSPVLSAPDRLYQRLLSRDLDESVRIAGAHVESHGYVDACDQLVLPALTAAANDAANRRISADEYESVVEHARTVVDMAAARSRELAPPPPAAAAPGRVLRVLCLGRETSDQLGHLMLQHALDAQAFQLELCSPDLLVAETVELMSRNRADVICIGSTPPGGMLAAKLLCRRMRKRFAQAPILVARWASRNAAADAESLRAAGASSVHTSIDELRLALIAVGSALQANAAPAAAAAAAGSPQTAAG